MPEPPTPFIREAAALGASPHTLRCDDREGRLDVLVGLAGERRYGQRDPAFVIYLRVTGLGMVCLREQAVLARQKGAIIADPSALVLCQEAQAAVPLDVMQRAQPAICGKFARYDALNRRAPIRPNTPLWETA